MRVTGEGPLDAVLMFVGQGPGFYEQKSGRVFQGRASGWVNQYLNGIDLPTRREVYLTNLYREWGGQDYVYTKADYERDAPQLDAEVAAVNPRVIVTLGAHALHHFMGPDTDLEATWGIPWQVGDRIIVPLHHPAAAMHSSDLACYIVAGFAALKQYWQHGSPQPRVLYDDPYPQPVYEEITSFDQLDGQLAHIGDRAGFDTEGYPYAPWSAQLTHTPGTGFLIRATRPDLLQRFGAFLAHKRPTLIYHSALHEFSMLPVLGLPTDLPFRDTMVSAYLLQVIPLGLKAGVARFCGMRMQSYMDLLGTVADDRAREYLTWLWEQATDDYEAACLAEFEWQVSCGRKLRKHPKLPKTPLQRSVERCLASKRPRTLWLEQDERTVAEGVKRLGFVVEPSLDLIEPPKAVFYGCRDSDASLRYDAELLPRVTAMGLDSVYDLELSTYPLIARMAQIGIKPDLPQFALLSEALGMEIDRLKGELVTATGEAGFNANSGDHVAHHIYDQLGIEPLKLTDSRERGSTNNKILMALEFDHPEHPVIGLIRQFRKVYKLKYTFVDTIPAHVHKWPYDGRIHTTFRTTTVVTGRLSASNPNMLAQPKRGQFTDEFKRGWVAEEGHSLYEVDESQVELRVLAHLSQDPVLLNAFRTGQDLHAKLAVRIFGGKEETYRQQCYERFAVKEVNFGIPNGMTNKGLTVALRSKGVNVNEDTAQEWLDETLALYSGLKPYMQSKIDEAKRDGYIRCLSGRIRYIGGIHAPDERVREEAERFAYSTAIQEGAQWILKRAEATIWQDILCPLWKSGQWVEPLLQIHDSLVFECEHGLERELHTRVSAAMIDAPKGFTVPLAVEGGFGPNLAQVEPL